MARASDSKPDALLTDLVEALSRNNSEAVTYFKHGVHTLIEAMKKGVIPEQTIWDIVEMIPASQRFNACRTVYHASPNGSEMEKNAHPHSLAAARLLSPREHLKQLIALSYMAGTDTDATLEEALLAVDRQPTDTQFSACMQVFIPAPRGSDFEHRVLTKSIAVMDYLTLKQQGEACDELDAIVRHSYPDLEAQIKTKKIGLPAATKARAPISLITLPDMIRTMRAQYA